MFGAKNPQESRKANQPGREHGITILTSGCSFSGKLYCRGASRIGGQIEGEIISENSLVIEEGAQIFASIQAEEAIIQGYVKGKIRASRRVELCANARFDGDIIAPSLIVREGAQFNGTSEMTPTVEAIDTKNRRNPTIVKELKKVDQQKTPTVEPIAIKTNLNSKQIEPEVPLAR